MTDYKRITRRNEDGTTWVKCVCCDNVATCDYTKESCCQVLQDRLAELEDLIEQGLLVKLPCRVGDILYVPTVYGGESNIIEVIVKDISICFEAIIANIEGAFSFNQIGKTIFLTKAEAEARLEQLKRSDK